MFKALDITCSSTESDIHHFFRHFFPINNIQYSSDTHHIPSQSAPINHYHVLIMLPFNIFLLLLFLQVAIQSSHAFSATSTSNGGIKIVGLPGNQIESLPSMYVNTFRRWIVEDNNKQLTTNDGTNNDNDSCTLQPIPIKGAGISASLSNGYVNPTTTTQLWWPSDLQTIQIRPVLNILYRNSMISYVSAGLDVRVPYQESGDVGEEESSWRNYGLNSQPIARQWTTLDIAMEKMFHVEGFILQNTDDNDDSQQQKKQTYDTLFPSLDNVSKVMEKVATFTAELDTLSPLADGFHIASFPLMDDWTDLPPPPPLPSTSSEEEEDEDTTNQDESVYKIVCLATSEPFGSKLIENGIDDDILVMSSTSVLEVDVCWTAPGGESPYLTEPYKSLYLKK